MIWIEKPDFSGGEIQLNAVMPQTIHAQDASQRPPAKPEA
jgi:hypothetical protein